MQAIILAAGKSTRTYPLTLTTPKPMLKVANKPILAHNLEKLDGIADEVILVVGHKKEIIKSYFGNKFRNIRLRYIVQKEQLGTGHALLLAKNLVKERFFVMMGDDIYPQNGIKQCSSYQYSVLTSRIKDPSNFGVFVVENHFVKNLVEKPKTFVSDLANTGLYILDKKIFDILNSLNKTERNEYELTSAVRAFAKESPVRCLITRDWLPIAYPWDLLTADAFLRKNKNSIGKNTRIDGQITNSSIGNNCRVNGTIKNSIIMDNTIIKDSFIEDSVIGNNVFFSGIIKSGDNILKHVNGKAMAVKKLGGIIGDNVTAVNVSMSSGVMIWPNKQIKNKEIENDII